MSKRVVRDAGVPTADFAVIESEADIAKVALPFRCSSSRWRKARARAWTPAPGSTTAAELDSVARDLLARFRQPVLVEEFLPGREFTVGITGTGADAAVLGVSEIVPKRQICRPWLWLREQGRLGGQAQRRAGATTRTREAAGEVALAAWRVLRCRDGGRADVRLDQDGQPRFIEVNPLAGIRPGYSDLCFIADFAGALLSAADRQIPGLLPGAPSGTEHENSGAAFRHRRRCAARGTGHADRRRGGGRGAWRARASAWRRPPSARTRWRRCWHGTAPDMVFNLVEGVDGQGHAGAAGAAPAGGTGHALHRRQRRGDGRSPTTSRSPSRSCATPALPRPIGAVPPDWARPGRPAHGSSRRRWKTPPSDWTMTAWWTAPMRVKARAERLRRPLRRRLVRRTTMSRAGSSISPCWAAGASHPADGGNALRATGRTASPASSAMTPNGRRIPPAGTTRCAPSGWRRTNRVWRRS